jgi:hypothetical protein
LSYRSLFNIFFFLLNEKFKYSHIILIPLRYAPSFVCVYILKKKPAMSAKLKTNTIRRLHVFPRFIPLNTICIFPFNCYLLLGEWYPREQVVHHQRYQPSDSNTNVDVKFIADDAFLEWQSTKNNVVANVCTKHMITRIKLHDHMSKQWLLGGSYLLRNYSTCRGIDPVRVQCNKNVDTEFRAHVASGE